MFLDIVDGSSRCNFRRVEGSCVCELIIYEGFVFWFQSSGIMDDFVDLIK